MNWGNKRSGNNQIEGFSSFKWKFQLLKQNTQWGTPVAVSMPSGQTLRFKQYSILKGTGVSWCLTHPGSGEERTTLAQDNGGAPGSKNIVWKTQNHQPVPCLEDEMVWLPWAQSWTASPERRKVVVRRHGVTDLMCHYLYAMPRSIGMCEVRV